MIHVSIVFVFNIVLVLLDVFGLVSIIGLSVFIIHEALWAKWITISFSLGIGVMGGYILWLYCHYGGWPPPMSLLAYTYFFGMPIFMGLYNIFAGIYILVTDRKPNGRISRGNVIQDKEE
jgi:hypothetical protein